MPFGLFLGVTFLKKVCTAPPNLGLFCFSEGDGKVALLAKKVCTAPPNPSDWVFFRAAPSLNYGEFRGLARPLLGLRPKRRLKSAFLDRFAIEEFRK